MQRFFESFPVFPRDKSGNIHLERIKELLTRIIYAGSVEAPGWGIAPRPAKHPALISLATYQRIQANLNGTAKAPARKDISEIFPLRNFVLCGDCGGPLTSCLSKGRNGHHPYYLCHKKGCTSYGKSIRRDVIEGEFAELVADMQPSKDAINTATKMFRMAWDYRLTSGASIAAAAKQELAALDRGIGQLLDRIVETDNQTVIRKYEERIEDMEKQKLLLAEKLMKSGKPVRSFDDTLRTALLFLQNPLKLWLHGGLEEKRMLLRIAFTRKLEYVRNQGFRTAHKALPFKAFSDFKDGIWEMVEANGESTSLQKPCYASKH